MSKLPAKSAPDLKENLVVQSNELINASYAMTVNEQRLLLACISQIDSRHTLENGAEFTLSVEQARDLFYSKGDQRHAYRDLEDASRRLFERKVSIDLGNNRELLTRFVQSIVFEPDDGRARLKFADEILPYLSQLEANFTRYRLNNIVQLTSSYAVRIYELIVSWAGQGLSYKELEIDTFKEMLGLGGKYKQNSQLKEKVTTPAIEQINASTDFELDIVYRKSRRTFKWVQLRFNRKAEAAAAEAAAKHMRIERQQHNETAKQKRNEAESAAAAEAERQAQREARRSAFEKQLAVVRKHFSGFKKGTIFIGQSGKEYLADEDDLLWLKQAAAEDGLNFGLNNLDDVQRAIAQKKLTVAQRDMFEAEED